MCVGFLLPVPYPGAWVQPLQHGRAGGVCQRRQRRPAGGPDGVVAQVRRANGQCTSHGAPSGAWARSDRCTGFPRFASPTILAKSSYSNGKK
jgi:hypothetical protein